MDKAKSLKYMIIGAGGTGGAIGSHLARAGFDVSFIARGSHLAAMKADGLRVIKPSEEFVIKPVKAYTTDEYCGSPDVIFVCLKGYSVDEMIPFISRTAGQGTIVIPVLNIFGTGGRMQAKHVWRPVKRWMRCLMQIVLQDISLQRAEQVSGSISHLRNIPQKRNT
jgi:ketopantoate reductase